LDFRLVSVRGDGIESRVEQGVDNLDKTGCAGIERMLFNQSRCAVWLEEARDGKVGNDDGRRDAVEHGAGEAGEKFAMVRVPWGSWWNQIEHRFWNGQFARSEGPHQGIQRCTLVGSRNDGDGIASVAPQGVNIVKSAQRGGGGFDLKSMM
jgi:hypothetical protein